MTPSFSPDRRNPRLEALATRALALTALAFAASACQSTPAGHSGFLSSYAGLSDVEKGQGGPRKRRDDALSDAVGRVYIEPSVLKVATDTPLRAEQQDMVRHEVDRQICYEVSKRFELAPAPAPDVGRLRTAIVHIAPTNPAGSAATAAASFFIPVPIVKIRPPKISGGLGVESELLAPDGRQVAAITWRKSTEGLSNMDPSLSPVGDALQLAEPAGDAVGKAFSTKARAKAWKKRAIPDPDPCLRYGPRRNAGRFVGGMLLGFGTGLYAPTIAGAGRPPEDAAGATKP